MNHKPKAGRHIIRVDRTQGKGTEPTGRTLVQGRRSPPHNLTHKIYEKSGPIYFFLFFYYWFFIFIFCILQANAKRDSRATEWRPNPTARESSSELASSGCARICARLQNAKR